MKGVSGEGGVGRRGGGAGGGEGGSNATGTYVSDCSTFVLAVMGY